jgi:hypothetical protein
MIEIISTSGIYPVFEILQRMLLSGLELVKSREMDENPSKGQLRLQNNTER